jgi:hypothetical protein
MFVWTLAAIAALVGAAMVVTGMAEEVPIIIRCTLQRTVKRSRRR